MDLSDDEIRRFAGACGDPQNEVAKQVMTAVGANSASGVFAQLLLAGDQERERILAMIRRAIRR